MSDAITMKRFLKNLRLAALGACASLGLLYAALAPAQIAAPAPLPALPAPPGNEPPAGNQPLAGLSIGVDAGRGLEAPTSRTDPKRVDAATRAIEADANLRVARWLEAYLRKAGARVAPLYNSRGAPAISRLGLAEASGVDFVISVHHSYSVTPDENVTAAYYSPASDKKLERVTRRVNESLASGLGIQATGPLSARHELTSRPDAPTVLVVCSLISNPDEFLHVAESDYNRREAQSIFLGILNNVREDKGIIKRQERGKDLVSAPDWRKGAARPADETRDGGLDVASAGSNVYYPPAAGDAGRTMREIRPEGAAKSPAPAGTILPSTPTPGIVPGGATGVPDYTPAPNIKIPASMPGATPKVEPPMTPLPSPTASAYVASPNTPGGAPTPTATFAPLATFDKATPAAGKAFAEAPTFVATFTPPPSPTPGISISPLLSATMPVVTGGTGLKFPDTVLPGPVPEPTHTSISVDVTPIVTPLATKSTKVSEDWEEPYKILDSATTSEEVDSAMRKAGSSLAAGNTPAPGAPEITAPPNPYLLEMPPATGLRPLAGAKGPQDTGTATSIEASDSGRSPEAPPVVESRDKTSVGLVEPAAPAAGGATSREPGDIALFPFKPPFRRPLDAPTDQTWLFGEIYETNPLKRGISFRAPAGSDVKAVADGVVVEANYGADPAPFLFYPRSVLLEHTEKIEGMTVYTMYGQMAEVAVQKGQKISRGAVVGKTGPPYDMNTNARDTEFEFEVRVEGKSPEHARNPELYLEPYDSHTGLIVGQIVDSATRALPTRRIDEQSGKALKSATDNPYYSYSLSYAVGVTSHPVLQETFVIGDVLAGTYALRFEGGAQREITVKPGMITFITAQSGAGGL